VSPTRKHGVLDALSPGWESGNTERSVRHLFSSDPAEVGRARRMVMAHLEAWGHGDEVEALTLAVSELVTNALVHGSGPIEVMLTAEDGTVRVEVADQGGGRPKLVQPEPVLASRGWGLRLVDGLADEWGSVSQGARTTVWMERHVPTRGGDDEPDREPS
jgi:anti-sigma regulatory factor (Ser/Thr protein kinase)